MMPIKTIVHATDFSAHSQCAWEMACALARDYGVRLFLVHVEPPAPAFAELGAIPPEPMDRRALEKMLAEIKPADGSQAVTRKLLVGDEAGEIIRFATENRADLIVMGTHGRTGLGRLILGSVAESVMREAQCPVMTVKSPMPLRAKEIAAREVAAS